MRITLFPYLHALSLRGRLFPSESFILPIVHAEIHRQLRENVDHM